MPKHFVSAYVTNTRLMGVLAIHARWHIDELPEFGHPSSDFHQFFYIDCEEAGLETYKSVFGCDRQELEMVEQALIGGLGSVKIDITERALRGLLLKYRDFNLTHNLPLPNNLPEYEFIFEDTMPLTLVEEHTLMTSICGEIVSDCQLVNYFLMRCFGRDYEGARYLTASWHQMNSPETMTIPENSRGIPLENDFPLDIYDSYVQATFCKNVIDLEKEYGDGSISYVCESLVEMNGEYNTVISKVVVKDMQVIGFEHCSGFHVSAAEAAMMLAKPEYVTVYEVLLSDEDMDNNISELTVGLDTIMSEHENGTMFMAFKPTNDHVNNRTFMLSNDVKGIYFLTDFGQLILASYDLLDIWELENRLKDSLLGPYMIPTAKYEFRESILFEFVSSDFDDFEDFLDYLNELNGGL
ncbi:MAG: hypothetical protein PUB09_04755 [Firmicutes bacterium]|nr:hypothetical protein [Bacillota bacterium]